jgi:hypothetical protein
MAYCRFNLLVLLEIVLKLIFWICGHIKIKTSPVSGILIYPHQYINPDINPVV